MLQNLNLINAEAFSDTEKVYTPNIKPKIVMITPFDFCNMKCIMCNIWKTKESKKILQNISKIKLFLSSIKSFFGTNDIQINFTGGEIFQHEIIFELLVYSTSIGFITHVDTNGTLLDYDKIHRLKNLGIRSISLSVDGYLSITHDKIRGIKGSHEKLMHILDILGNENFVVTINTVIMDFNI